MTNTETTTTRYTRNCPTISAVTVWYNDGAFESHSTPRCRRWGTPRRHTHRDIWARTTVTDRPANWICAVCTADDPSPADTVTRTGSATCESCDRTLRVTAYPTTLIAGVGQVRDMRACRDCRKAGYRVADTHDLGVDACDPIALAAAVASDWRPRTRGVPAMTDREARAYHKHGHIPPVWDAA